MWRVLEDLTQAPSNPAYRHLSGGPWSYTWESLTGDPEDGKEVQLVPGKALDEKIPCD